MTAFNQKAGDETTKTEAITKQRASLNLGGTISSPRYVKKRAVIFGEPIALRVEEIRQGLEPKRFLAFSFDKKSLKAE